MPDPCVLEASLREPVKIPGGRYRLGETRFYPEEGPIVTVEVRAFDIDAHEVTNGQFAEFVDATGYVTRAERGLPEAEFDQLPEEMRRAGSAVFRPPDMSAPLSAMSWWRFVEGASWRAPDGPGSSIAGKASYPVVHIAYEDAAAYAQWRGRRLPTEAEWEVAARGGVEGASYAWGETPPDDLEKPAANTWQGIFPYINQKSDGYDFLSPIGCFEPNPFGLFDMIGNVWEWTSDDFAPRRGEVKFDTIDSESVSGNGTIKGGSYLCAENYCVRYRPAARQSQERNFSASHIGFRTASSYE